MKLALLLPVDLQLAIKVCLQVFSTVYTSGKSLIEQIAPLAMLPLSAFPTTLVPSPEPVSSGGGKPTAGVHVVPKQADTRACTCNAALTSRSCWTHTYTRSPRQILSMKLS